MKTKSIYLFYTLLALISFLTIQVSYIDKTKSISSKSIQSKKDFINIVQLPDIALSTDLSYIRHRSLTNTFDIYNEDGSLREYSLGSFTYNQSDLRWIYILFNILLIL